MVKTLKIPEKQKLFLQKKREDYLKEFPELQKLIDRLLSIGGEEVCLSIEEDLEKLLTRGKDWKRTPVALMKGRDSQCHFNSACLWETNKDKVKICTGWGLSKDGI